MQYNEWSKTVTIPEQTFTSGTLDDLYEDSVSITFPVNIKYIVDIEVRNEEGNIPDNFNGAKLHTNYEGAGDNEYILLENENTDYGILQSDPIRNIYPEQNDYSTLSFTLRRYQEVTTGEYYIPETTLTFTIKGTEENPMPSFDFKWQTGSEGSGNTLIKTEFPNHPSYNYERYISTTDPYWLIDYKRYLERDVVFIFTDGKTDLSNLNTDISVRITIEQCPQHVPLGSYYNSGAGTNYYYYDEFNYNVSLQNNYQMHLDITEVNTEISTPADLYNMRYYQNGNYELINNIDMLNFTATHIGIDCFDYGDNYKTYFDNSIVGARLINGGLDGNGYTIFNLPNALLGTVASYSDNPAIVENLTLNSDVEFFSDDQPNSPFASYIGEKAIIRNCTIKGSLTSSEVSIYGFAGQIMDYDAPLPEIYNCAVEADITSTNGVTGFCPSLTIDLQDCHVTGDLTVTGGGLANGLFIETLSGTLVERCYFEGTINGNNAPASGIAYSISGQIKKSYVEANINNNSLVSGFSYDVTGLIEECYVKGSGSGDGAPAVGFVNSGDGEINNCYSRMTIDNTSASGNAGFMGSATGMVLNNCYFAGLFTAPDTVSGFAPAGFTGATANKCYYDIELMGVEPSELAEPRTTVEMTYLYNTANVYNSWNFGEIPNEADYDFPDTVDLVNDTNQQIIDKSNDSYPELYAKNGIWWPPPLVIIWVKKNDQWNIADGYVKKSGTWKPITQVNVKKNGQWY